MKNEISQWYRLLYSDYKWEGSFFCWIKKIINLWVGLHEWIKKRIADFWKFYSKKLSCVYTDVCNMKYGDQYTVFRFFFVLFGKYV